PRARRTAADAVVGRDALRRAVVRHSGAAARDLPRDRDLPLLAVVQPARRRAARRSRPPHDQMSLLDVQDLSVRFDTDDGSVHAVDRLTFSLDAGEVLGVVGESGCGKSVSAMSLLQLLPETAHVTGRAEFDGLDLINAPKSRLRDIRGREIAFVFQEPMTSLTPSFKVGNQLDEVLRRHLDISRSEARKRAIELLELVRIPAPKRRIHEY